MGQEQVVEGKPVIAEVADTKCSDSVRILESGNVLYGFTGSEFDGGYIVWFKSVVRSHSVAVPRNMVTSNMARVPFRNRADDDRGKAAVLNIRHSPCRLITSATFKTKLVPYPVQPGQPQPPGPEMAQTAGTYVG